MALFLLILSSLFLFLAAGVPEGDPVLHALRRELDRSLATFSKEKLPPYYLSYEVTESQRAVVVASFGKIVEQRDEHTRFLDVDLRVGSPQLDNTRTIFNNPGSSLGGQTKAVSLSGDEDALRGLVWYATDKAYKSAVEQLIKTRAEFAVRVEREDTSGDFAAGARETYQEKPCSLAFNRAGWEEKLQKYGRPFSGLGTIYSAQASFTADAGNVWFVNSEGTELAYAQPRYTLSITASTKAPDGMTFDLYQTYVSFTPDGFPADSVVLRQVDTMIANLQALRTAPVVEPYSGPALLSGRASAVFFHEVLGHRLEGQGLKEERDSQTFKKKLGEPILPECFSMFADPTRSTFNGQDLNGHYLFDNQGIKARRVDLVTNGKLVGFLMSRSPISGFAQSNGHGRKQVGYIPVSRQSNIFVESSQSVPPGQLKEMLIAECKKQHKPFGLFFKDIQGGFTMTQRVLPNAFNVTPVLVYKIYPDGREELVRGVNLVGTPLNVITNIVAADNQPAVFNGTCGAASGWVPVSAVAPGILVSQVEVQKKEKSQEKVPLLPAPLNEHNNK